MTFNRIILAATMFCAAGHLALVRSGGKLASVRKGKAEVIEKGVALPKDVPPVLAMATAQENDAKSPMNGSYQIKLTAPRIRYEVVSRESAPPRSKLAQWEDVVVKVKPWTRVLNFESASQVPDSRIVGIDGNDVPMKEVLKRLRKQSPVLVSVSGKMVAPYYLQLAKKDTLIILLSRKDGMGDRNLLASEWPSR